METTSSARPPEAESDSAGEGTEPKETAGIMSPEGDVTMATSGMVTAERDQAFDTEKLGIIASTFEEICVFLYQAKNLIVSVQFVSMVQTWCKTVWFLYSDPNHAKSILRVHSIGKSRFRSLNPDFQFAIECQIQKWISMLR